MLKKMVSRGGGGGRRTMESCCCILHKGLASTNHSPRHFLQMAQHSHDVEGSVGEGKDKLNGLLAQSGALDICNGYQNHAHHIQTGDRHARATHPLYTLPNAPWPIGSPKSRDAKSISKLETRGSLRTGARVLPAGPPAPAPASEPAQRDIAQRPTRANHTNQRT